MRIYILLIIVHVLYDACCMYICICGIYQVEILVVLEEEEENKTNNNDDERK